MTKEMSKGLKDKLQKMHEDKYGDKMTESELNQASGNLVGLVELMLDISMKEMKYKEPLAENPGGYKFDNHKHYSCILCSNGSSDEFLWYDKQGKKCFGCKQAIDDGVVPAHICEHRDSYYTVWDIERHLHLKPAISKKLAKQGVLKMRTISYEKRQNLYLFLRADNEGVLPSKKLLKDIYVEDKEVRGRYKTYTWDSYQFPKDVIGEYKIFEHIEYYKDYTPPYKISEK